jgi:hypothetical protein
LSDKPRATETVKDELKKASLKEAATVPQASDFLLPNGFKTESLSILMNSEALKIQFLRRSQAKTPRSCSPKQLLL